MSEVFDLVALGSGPAAARVVTRCAQANWKVAVIDPNPVGGTCALHGCNPKKVLVHAAELVDRARRLDGKGTNLGSAVICWEDLMRFKRTFTEPVTAGRRRSFAELGIEIIRDSPRFVGPTSIALTGRTLRARRWLIATGAVPAELPLAGADLLLSSDEFLELESLPDRVTFVGGGYIAFEFAHVAARAGAKATILDQSLPLDGFDHDLVQRLIERSRLLGIEVMSHTPVDAVQRDSAGGFLVTASGAEGPFRLSTDLVVHAAGRVPNVQGLDVEQANVRYSSRGIEVNEFFQSVTNPGVYAAGDVAATEMPPLTPAANYQGRIVAQNMLEGTSVPNQSPIIPTAVFTIPPLAAVGMTENQIRRAGIDCEIKQGDWSEFGSVRKVGETHAMFKVLIDKSSGQILGAHLLGPEAPEVINLFALAMGLRVTASALKQVPFAFPTFVSDIHSML